MSGNRPISNDVDVDLRQLLSALTRNWFRILFLTGLATAAAIAYVMTATPHYRAETRILIEARESVFTRPGGTGVDAERPLLDEEGITSQVEVISSPDILRDVARSLDLAGRTEFQAEISSLGRMLILLGLRSDPSQASREDHVLKVMRENLQVYRVDRSRVIVVSYASEDPQLAADIPNAIAEAFLEVQQEAKLLSNADATQWLEPEIADLRTRVREAEEAVAQYRAGSNLLIGQNNSTLATQQLAEMSSELTRVRAARSEAESRATAIREALASGASADAFPEVMASGLVQRLRERQVQLSAELADLSTTLLDNHPRIRALRSQLSEVSAQMRTEMRTVLASQESTAASARQRELSITADLNRLMAEAARAGDDEVELRALEREAAAQRALLESYLTRFREAASRADRNYLPVDARIFARATPPFEAYFPRKVPIVGAAFVGSLLLLAVITLLMELFSGRAMRPAPGARFDPVEDMNMPAPAAARIEARVLRGLSVVEAAQKIAENSIERAIFLSPEGDEATATSVMVARELADGGVRVIFIDMTAAGTPSTSMLETGRLPGITNLLCAQAQFSDIIRGDLYSDAHVMASGTAERERAMVAADRLPIVLQSLGTAYDVVIIEFPADDIERIAKLAGDNTAVFVSIVDATEEMVEETEAAVSVAGVETILRVSPEGHDRPGEPSERTAA